MCSPSEVFFQGVPSSEQGDPETKPINNNFFNMLAYTNSSMKYGLKSSIFHNQQLITILLVIFKNQPELIIIKWESHRV